MRISTWEQELSAYLAACKAADFGANLPCAFYADGAVQAITGKSVAPELSKGQIAKTLRAHRAQGEAFLVRMVGEKFPERPLSFARAGDLVLHQGCLGICTGAEALFLAQEHTGLERVPISDCERAWAV